MSRVRAATCLAAAAACLAAASLPGMGGDAARSAREIAAVARAGPPWAADTVAALARKLLGDRTRFYGNAGYRKNVLDAMTGAFPSDGPPLLREMLLFRISEDGEVPFDDFERLQFGWGAVPRRSAARRDPFRMGSWRFSEDVAARIEASIYSLPGDYIALDPARAFLDAVRKAAPNRTTLVFVDPARRLELEAFARERSVVLLDTLGRDYTPWPRDTFSLVRNSGGGVRVLVRPPAILQEARLADNAMGRELVKDLPEALDRSWGSPRWAVSTVPFHNGQVILTRSAAWISIHSVEPRILEILRAKRVPVESFTTAKGTARYVAAARRAGEELSRLYGRPARFVHPLPGAETARAGSEMMTAIGGGAGFDLDSIVTFVARGRDATEALVGDVAAGSELLRGAAAADLETFGRGFGLSGSADVIRRELIGFNATRRPADLSRFLDLVAGHLRAEGLPVRRLPFFLVPAGMLADRSSLPADATFAITWNNVVPEADSSGCRAEGFSNLFPAGDDAASRAFSAAGCRLIPLPPLVSSIERNGGYRCASNHLRAAIESTP